MYLAVDIGGTKTLVAVFNKNGQILEQIRFQTNKNYSKFLSELETTIKNLTANNQIEAACCAAPGRIDRAHGIVSSFGNLPWHNVPLRYAVSKILGGSPVIIENDANLAGLSEAVLVRDKYKKVLYLTISTGIGDGIIINGIIDPSLADSESGQMILEHDGKLQKWEDFASGRALREKYGKPASEITDEHIWHAFVKGLAQGIDELVAVIDPDVIILGGGVGTHFDRFGHFLVHELKKYENKMVSMPPVVEAKRPEEAVIYGCYELIKQNAWNSSGRAARAPDSFRARRDEKPAKRGVL